MSGLLRARAVPIIGSAALGSATWYGTSGGRNQLRPRAEASTSIPGPIPVSETLESIAGSGGKRAKTRKAALEKDAKDTRIMSHEGNAPSKRNARKIRVGE